MLGPIPFPLSTRVGTDLCSVPRITALLQRRLKGMNNPPSQQGSRSFDFAEDLGQATHGLNRSNQPEQLDKFDRWGIRVFNRLEWPEFKERSRDYADLSVVRQSNFERWTAGRFAAKEAAVKAHVKRKLYLPNISVLTRPPLRQRTFGLRPEENDRRPIMLIDPPSTIVIRMSATVAHMRGLKARPAPKRDEGNQIVSTLNEYELEASLAGPVMHSGIYYRAARIRMEDRRVADMSISHDGEYAFAVVMAAEDYQGSIQDSEMVDDDGNGPPIHEPEWGDNGWDAIPDDLLDFWKSME